MQFINIGNTVRISSMHNKLFGELGKVFYYDMAFNCTGVCDVIMLVCALQFFLFLVTDWRCCNMSPVFLVTPSPFHVISCLGGHWRG